MPLASDAIARILAEWPVARLATVGEGGAPEQVPIVFAVLEGVLWSPIDGKPKRGPELARVRNLRRDPRASVLLDHYDPDWTRLWWLRLEGTGTVVGLGSAGAAAAADALRVKYPHYASGVTPLFAGEPALIRIEIARRISWSAAGPG